jgi:hypothetical protein
VVFVDFAFSCLVAGVQLSLLFAQQLMDLPCYDANGIINYSPSSLDFVA